MQNTIGSNPEIQRNYAASLGILPLPIEPNSTHSAAMNITLSTPPPPPLHPIMATIVHGSRREHEPSMKANDSGGGKPRPWHSPSSDGSCHTATGKCQRADIAIPPLLVVSLDGFAREYLDRGLTPSLEAFGECGARAEWLFASYPSKTFPNHYSMATGLYPAWHGVVDNLVYDAGLAGGRWALEDMVGVVGVWGGVFLKF
jgi:Type I phosphodiesterase / nucleotide pyrophosphatase